MNVRMPRWINASIVKYFTDNLTPTLVFIQSDRRTTESVPLWVEVRIRGPDFEDFGSYVCVNLDLNILVNLVPDGTNTYSMQDYTGLVAALFSNIPIFKYGPAADIQNDGSTIGCLTLNADKVRIHDYGKPDIGTNLQQSTVEASFKGVF